MQNEQEEKPLEQSSEQPPTTAARANLRGGDRLSLFDQALRALWSRRQNKRISPMRESPRDKSARVFLIRTRFQRSGALVSRPYLSRKGAALLLRMRVGLPEKTNSVSPRRELPEPCGTYAPHTREPFKRATGTGNLLMNTEAESSSDARVLLGTEQRVSRLRR